MKLAIFVHECFLEIGHSRALIETINNLDQDKIENLKIVSYDSENPEKLFPRLKGKTSFHKVPCNWLFPSIIRAMFYQVYTLIYSLVFLNNDYKKIGIGIASLNLDIVNVQFVHQQWTPYFFETRKLCLINYIYKRILFSYYHACENFLFSNKKLEVIVLANFVGKYLDKTYALGDRLHLAYSGINLNSFTRKMVAKEEAHNHISKSFPEFKDICLDEPIYLFVGAYERKGLGHVINAMKDKKNAQLVVIGNSEFGSNYQFPSHLKVFQVKFTKELHYFYSLADHFVFPSIYEPFGLVLIEAASMGLVVHSTIKNVGANEILKNLPEIILHSSPDNFSIEDNRSFTSEEKAMISQSRLEKLKEFNWKKTADVYKAVLSQK